MKVPFPDLTPYELLEISPSATLPEIIQAYQKAVRNKHYPVPRLTQAMNDLRNPRKRGEYDLLTISNLGDSRPIQQQMGNLPSFQFVSDSISPLQVKDELVICGVEDLVNDDLPIPDSPLDWQISPRFETLTIVLAPIPFPS
jgi:curved DNA-binding protein CbpA